MKTGSERDICTPMFIAVLFIYLFIYLFFEQSTFIYLFIFHLFLLVGG